MRSAPLSSLLGARLGCGALSTMWSHVPTCWYNVQAYIGVHTSAWSYNSLIQAWEPILEPWNLIMKADMNTGAMVCPHLGVDFQYFLSAHTYIMLRSQTGLWLVRVINNVAPLQNPA